MKITALTINDYKRVRHVAITPDADSYLILIGGKNRQGKSTTLDAISAAFGGKNAIAADPVRHGAESAAIRIELDGGALVIERAIEPGGATQLIVRDADGPLRRPQEILDKLVGARFLDPLAFLRLKPADQRAALMRVIPDAAEIEKLDERRDRSFRQRTDTGRDLARARGECDRLPPAVEPAPAIDVAALVAEHAAFAQQQRAGDGIGNVVAQLDKEEVAAISAARREALHIKQLEQQLVDARSHHASLTEFAVAKASEAAAARERLIAAAAAWTATAPRRAALEVDLARAGDHNTRRAEDLASNRRRAETVATVERLAAEVDKLSAAITGVDLRKSELLAAAKLPVDGLVIGQAGLLVTGDDGIAVPFADASASQQWTIALGLAIAAAPQLDDIWIKDAAVLEDEAIEAVGALAAASGKRCWIERVGTRDPGVIVISDGRVVK